MKVTYSTPCDELLRAVNFPGHDSVINPVANLTWESFSRPDDRERIRTMLAGRTMKQLTIAEIAAIDPNWNAPSILEGMQGFAECAVRANYYHDVYAGTPLEGETALMAMTVPDSKRFVVVCAGGGYGGCCTMIEAFPLAKHLNDLGITAFVLYYRVGKAAHYPNPMDDLAAAIRYILERRAKFGVSGDDYGVMGFSAGGHLAATWGNESIGWKHYGLPRPSMLFLGYPVVTLCEEKPSGTARNLLQEDRNDPAIQGKYSVDRQFTPSYPPTYLWQCTGDPSVPISHSRMLADLLERNHIPHIYETFEAKAHSWGLGTGTLAEGWLDRAVKFWDSLSGKNV